MTKSCGAQAIGSATALRSRVGDGGAPIEEKMMPKSGGAQGKRRAKSSGAVASLTALRPPPPHIKASVFWDSMKENPGMMSGGAQPAASSPAPPSRQSRVTVHADGAQIEEKRRTESAGTRVAASSAQSRVALRADRAPKEEKGGTKIGSIQVDTSLMAPPSRQSRVALRAEGAQMEEKRRTESALVAASSAPPSRQSRVALRADSAPKKEKGATKIGSTQVDTSFMAPPSHQSRVALRPDGAQMEEKRKTKSAGTHLASSSAPTSRQSRVALRDRATEEEKGGTKIGSTQVDTSSMAPPLRQSRATMSCNGPLIEDKKMTKSGGAHSVTSSTAMPPRRGRVALLPNGLPVDGVARAEVIEFYTHRDGAIYGRIATDSLARRYRLHDTSETALEPMMRWEPTDYCSPNWMSCKVHDPSTMMQIFSLKLAYPNPAGDQVQLYGFFAVRDSMDPLRNYVFNRSRDDPLIVEREDGLIKMSGPKRGIWWHDMALVEFDMRIKRGEKESDDLQLIDGAVLFNEATSIHASVATQRIDGEYGSVDMCYALLYSAMEATVQIEVAELLGGFSLRATAFYISGLVHQEMQLFDGIVPGPDGCRIYKLDKCVIGTGGQIEDDPHKYMVSCNGRRRYEPEKCAVADGDGGQRYELGKHVFAFPKGTKLGLKMIICQSGGSSEAARFCISPASTHGNDTFAFDLGFATIHVKITWSTLPGPHLVSRCCHR